MVDRRGRFAEMIVALTIAAFAAAMLVDGRHLGANPFEPLGSRTIPSGTAWITIALACLVLGEAALALRRGTDPAPAGEQWGAVALALLLTIAYAGVLALGIVRYRWATMAFIPLAVLAVTDDRRAALPWAVGLGAAYGFGLDYIFRHILVTDIP